MAYLLIPGAETARAERVQARDAEWVVPRLWRSELRNVLARSVWAGLISLDDAVAAMSDALALVQDAEYEADSSEVLRLAAMSRCTAYDCEFVALARALAVPLVTADRALLAAFPDTAVSLDAFAAS